MFIRTAVFWALIGGLLEGATRAWLQSAGLNSFDERLTVVSARLLWVAPLAYIPLFAAVGLAGRLLSGLAPRVAWIRVVSVCCAAMAFQAPLSATGRLATYSTVLLAVGLAVALNRVLQRKPENSSRAFRYALPAAAAVVAIAGGSVEFSRWRTQQGGESGLSAPVPGAPNILVVIVDALRADHLPSYGYARATAPAMQRVAAEGVQFNWALAASSWTLPSHVSMLTGHYPSSHGSSLERYDNRYPTIASVLQDRGYRTAAITANTSVFTRAHGFGPGFLRFDDSFYSLADGFFRTYYGSNIHKRFLQPAGWNDRPARRTAENVTRAAEAWIQRDPARPFFLVLNYFDAHDPYRPPQPFRSRFSEKASPGGRFNSFRGDPSASFTGQDLQDEIDAYDGSVAYVDHWVGKLLDSLGAGAGENTVVVLTADHGESLGQHGTVGHGTSLYSEQIRVPLIVRFPGKVPAGLVVEVPVSHTSLAPTLLELAGGDSTAVFPGPSLRPLWTRRSGPDNWPSPLSELSMPPWEAGPDGPDPLSSVVDGGWHFIDHARTAPELFDLLHDPREEKNLAAFPEHRLRVERYRELIKAGLRPRR